MRALVLLAALAGCRDDRPIPAAERGAELFADPGFSDSGFNAFSCATCHGTDDATPRIGPSLRGVVRRATWWGGYAPRLEDAVRACSVFFMRASGFDPQDDRGRALYEYLVSISPEGAQPASPVTVVENVTTVPRGDPARGRAVWDAVCRGCHGDPHTGRGRISDLVAIVPEASLAFAHAFDIAEPQLVLIEKVRHGQFFGVGGNMPFFSREALSDADLGALIAYLGL